MGKEFGLRTVAYFTQSCAVNNIYYHVYRGEIKAPVVAAAEEEIRIAGMPLLTMADMPSLVQVGNPYPGFSDLVINQFGNVEEADWLVCNSFYELEHQVCLLKLRTFNFVSNRPGAHYPPLSVGL